MKLTLPCTALLLALALFASRVSPQAGAVAGKEKAEETELAGHMEKIEDALKLLRKQVKSDAPAALATLAAIQQQSLACKALVPALAGTLPESERPALVTAYRRTMVDFLLRQLELEAALLDGDAPAAQAAFERLREMEDSAHERFAPEEDG